MRICVIDGRGGGLGSRLIERLLPIVEGPHEIVALGTNSAAAAAMAKAGVLHVGVGAQAIKRAVGEADLILGSLSIVLPGAMLGEVTATMADAILRAPGRKLLLPLNHLGVEVVGADSPTLARLIEQTIQRVQATLRPSIPA
ncbi:MAG: DUF3842 family protein [Nitrospirae bacterium]|nr:DUF3842 family protein [Nitrospirota bacterium]